MREISATLTVMEGQYWISDSDPRAELVVPDPGGASGLVGISPGLAIVITGTQFGDVSLTVQSDDSDPGLDPRPWDEVVEVSVVSGAGGQGLAILSDGQGPGELQSLTPSGAGSYRIRVHARGRDAGANEDAVDGGPVEDHLVQIWPAPAAAEIIHKITDGYGEGFREAPAGPEPRLPQGDFATLPVSQPVTATSRATVMLQSIDASAGGCEFWFKIVVDVSGMAPRDEKRARRAVEGYEGAALPESTDPGPLRIAVTYSDGRSAGFAQDPSSLPRSGPGITPCRSTRYSGGRTQVAEEGFWLLPLPPPEPFTLTFEWPAVGIPPATITIDGAAIAEAARTISAT